MTKDMVYLYEVPQGTSNIDFRVGAYIVTMRLMRSPTFKPMGYIFITDLKSVDCTSEFVDTKGFRIPASAQNLRNILNIVTNTQKTKGD